jgi:hypothetical protein
MMASYCVPSRFFEQMAVATEQEKPLIRQEVLEWIFEHIEPILRVDDVLVIPGDTGEPVACERPDYLVQ